MKTTARISVLILSLVLMLSAFCFTMQAEEAPTESYEMVLVFDVSTSMKYSDPDMIAIEASRALAHYAPTYADFYLSIVIFSDTASVAAERINVTDNGLENYRAILDKIRDNTLDGAECWNGATNTGDALEMAKNIIVQSTATNRSVLLFTDGKVEITDVNGNRDNILTEASRQKAKSVAEQLKQSGIFLDCIGLNPTDATQIDKDFLNEIAGITGGIHKFCESAAQIVSNFNDFFARIVDGTHKEEEQVPVQPDKWTDFDTNIYGDAIKEVSFSLQSDTVISEVIVKDPSGKAWVHYNIDTNKDEIIDTEACTLGMSPDGTFITIKLKRPADGVWWINMKSKTPGIVKINSLYLYELALRHSFDASQALHEGENLSFSTHLYNLDIGKDIKTLGIYTDESTKASAQVTGPDGTKNYVGTFNAEKMAFDFNVSLEQKGTYEVRCIFENTQFKANTTFTVEVAGSPFGALVLDAPTSGASCKNGAKITVTLKDKQGNDMPAAGDVVLNFKSGTEVFTYTIPVADFAGAATASYTFIPAKVGDYEVSATYAGVTETKSFTCTSAEITVNPPEDEFSETNSDGKTTFEIDVSDLFDGGEGAFTYTVTTDGNAKIEAELDGTTLRIEVSDYVSGKVTVTATDAFGGSASCDVAVSLKSPTGSIIGIVIAIIVVIVLAVVLLLIIAKRRIPGMAFNVKITDNDTYHSVVFSVVNLSKKKRTKANMSLAAILDNDIFSNMVKGDMDPEVMDAFFTGVGNKITVSGLVTKKGLSINAQGKKRTFLGKSATTVTAGNYSVAFGKSSAFIDDDYN